MLKAVFRPSELTVLPDKMVISSPTSYPDLARFAPIEEVEDELVDIDEYQGPTADDLRREAEMFKTRWEEEKEHMAANARTEADNIIQDAQNAAFAEVKRKTDEALIIKQQAEEEAERIIADARIKAGEIEFEIRQNLETERKEAQNRGREEGYESGFADGKAEVNRLIERTQIVLERAQNKRGEILSETEKEIIDLVLLITRKVIKVLSESQRNIIVTNVIQALRKVKAKGNVIIRVNLADLQLTTEHKQDFIKMMEGAASIQIVEDSSVDSGGCIIETDFGEIDARIASQLAELESKILEISPLRSSLNRALPPPVVRTANLSADLLATSALLGGPDMASQFDSAMNLSNKELTNETPTMEGEPQVEEEEELSSAANAALTASAALAAIATMAAKGKREADKKILEKIEHPHLRKSDPQAAP
jgi:flagellar assembly protein FliH